ncbi:hypothetical protein CYMTET_12923 [Cymbomonas tetramitiformis]|uniref:Uncharacterized protein n=1 Tax=Cymbomonas tetramitiformis TaxID=36881 RepID=A0AAE0GJG7_9CHLO|nr:hypothetical protein CYMTET_12923 [Cymbomonas tetramitiformis]
MCDVKVLRAGSRNCIVRSGQVVKDRRKADGVKFLEKGRALGWSLLKGATHWSQPVDQVMAARIVLAFAAQEISL